MARTATIVLLSAALALSCYLLVRTLALVAGTAAAGDVCSTLFERGCDATLRDPTSQIGGIPLAAWGVIHFGSLLGLLALGRLLGPAVRDTMAAAAALLALVGGVASFALIALIAAGVAPLCPLCLVVNGLNLAAIVPIFRWTGRPVREVAGDWRRALRYLTGGPVALPEAVPLRSTAFACVALAAIVLYQWTLIEGDRAVVRGKQVNPEQVIEAFSEAPVVEIPVDEDAPALGSPTARATLVVFSDAFCPACRGFWNVLPRLAGPYGDDLRVVFKHFPLDPPCNADVAGGLHPHACQAALALEAAHWQGRFWEYHALVESPDPKQQEDVFLRAATAAELDIEHFRTDMADPSLEARLERDVALGTELGVTATPTMFLDGRRIATPTPKALAVLLEHVLGDRAHGAHAPAAAVGDEPPAEPR